MKILIPQKKKKKNKKSVQMINRYKNNNKNNYYNYNSRIIKNKTQNIQLEIRLIKNRKIYTI